jgi:hypothetical protein
MKDLNEMYDVQVGKLDSLMNNAAWEENK